MDARRWRKRELVMEAVCSDPDLVALILRGNVGTSTVSNASLVCKAWLGVCRSDEGVLRGAALHRGLTKAAFMKLFAVPPSVAASLPHAVYFRRAGGYYFQYWEEAVDMVLAGPDAMAAWRERLRARGAAAATAWPATHTASQLTRKRLVGHSQAEREEQFHKRATPWRAVAG